MSRKLVLLHAIYKIFQNDKPVWNTWCKDRYIKNPIEMRLVRF